MEVSIVIVNYNTMQMTSECVDSIYETSKDVSFEVILVDNASTDGSKELFENDKRVRYVYSYENMGFGRANNVGMMLAKGKYIFLLNSDTLLINNAVKLFYDYAENHEKTAFYGCWLENQKGETILSAEPIITPPKALLTLLKYYSKGIKKKTYEFKKSDDECVKVGYITGADMFFHRRVYEISPGFDHNFFMYYEECDWQLQASKIGIFSYIINGPRIIHLCGASQKRTSVFNPKKFAIRFKSEYYYMKKNFPKLQYAFYRILNPLMFIPIFLFARHASWKTAWSCILASFRGK